VVAKDEKVVPTPLAVRHLAKNAAVF
jgi:hypothetical protein